MTSAKEGAPAGAGDPERAKGHWGGQVAGPAVRDVIDDTLRYLAVAPDNG